MSKRILVVAHYPPLRASRVSLLVKAGYSVASVEFDDEAMTLLGKEHFDLILIGRKSQLAKRALDERLRERFPYLLILRIESRGEGPADYYPSKVIDSQPASLMRALQELLGKAMILRPIDQLEEG